MVSCWTISLNIFHSLSDAAFSVISNQGNATDSTLHLAFSTVFLLAIFMTPVWTSMFMHSVLTPDLIGTTARSAQSMARKLLPKRR